MRPKPGSDHRGTPGIVASGSKSGENCGFEIACVQEFGQQESIELHVGDRVFVVLANARGSIDDTQKIWIIQITDNQSGKTGSGRKLIVVCTLLKVELVAVFGLSELGEVFQSPFCRFVEVSAVDARLKSLDEIASECARIKLPFPGDRFEQYQRTIAVVRLVTRHFSKMIVTFFGCFEAVDALWIKLLPIVEIVDPVSTQSCSIPDKLAPDSATEAIFARDSLRTVR